MLSEYICLQTVSAKGSYNYIVKIVTICERDNYYLKLKFKTQCLVHSIHTFVYWRNWLKICLFLKDRFFCFRFFNRRKEIWQRPRPIQPPAGPVVWIWKLGKCDPEIHTKFEQNWFLAQMKYCNIHHHFIYDIGLLLLF